MPRLRAWPVVAAPHAGIFLSPGAIHCASTPSVVTTILGSCVAVCLWDSHVRVGGMNHYVLPHQGRDTVSTRFGDVAIDQLIEGMARLGCHLSSLRAKLFGGAAVLPFGANADTVGNQNVRIALELLRHHGIPLLARRTGGHTGVLIRLYTETGEVLVRRLAAGHTVNIQQLAVAVTAFGG
jgi:chemotaxis protein CheD